LKKARGDDYDGVVVALAGIRRLGLQSEAAQIFEPDVIVPAPGQGALALEIRDADEELAALLQNVQDAETSAAVRAERALLAMLGSGCRAPFGAYASVREDSLILIAMLSSNEGSKGLFRVTASGSSQDPESVAQDAYHQLVASGAAHAAGITGGDQ
jgi:hydroxymethylbilane synthase